MKYKLNDILDELEKTAGFPVDKEKPSDSESNNGEKSSKDEKKEGDKDDKKDKKDEQEKSAAVKSGAELATQIMEKLASIQIEQNKGEEMNKQASDAGKALAATLLEKLANVGDTNTTNGIPEGTVPNKTQRDLATQVAEHNMIIQATPGTDGAGNGGTVNQIFDAIVADAAAKGVVLQGGQTPSAPAEGAQDAAQAPNQVAIDESREKMAALNALVDSGVDFNEAISLVKKASDELEAEHEGQIKQAALNELMSKGVDFDLAVTLIRNM